MIVNAELLRDAVKDGFAVRNQVVLITVPEHRRGADQFDIHKPLRLDAGGFALQGRRRRDEGGCLGALEELSLCEPVHPRVGAEAPRGPRQFDINGSFHFLSFQSFTAAARRWSCTVWGAASKSAHPLSTS